MYDEHAAMTAADPAFRPARPVRPTGVRPLAAENRPAEVLATVAGHRDRIAGLLAR